MRKTGLVALILLLAITSFSQNSSSKEAKRLALSKENAFIGGNLTIPFINIFQGAGTTMIGANPHFGYAISKTIDLAAVLNFQTNKFDYSTNGGIVNKSILGFGAFARYYPIDFVFLQLQPEINSVTKKETYSFTGSTTTKTTNIKPSLLVGVGYKRGFTRGRTFAYATILYDLISTNSPYAYDALSLIPGVSNTPPIVLRVGMNYLLSDLKRR